MKERQVQNPKRATVKNSDGEIICEFHSSLWRGEVTIDYSGPKVVIQQGKRITIVPDDAFIDAEKKFWSKR